MLWIIICASLGGVLYGYDIGVISGALLFLEKSIPMTNTQTGVIVGAVLGGGLIGTLITGHCADHWGRRTMILVACVVFSAGVTAILFADSFATLLASRLLLGVGVGIISVAVPLYLSEIAPSHMRGRSVTMFQLFLTLGILLAYIVDLILTPSGNWRAMFAVIYLPTALLWLGMLRLPETPRWLLSHGKEQQARAVLQQTRPDEDIESKMANIRRSLQQTQSGWSELLNKRWWKPLSIALAIAALNQLTGINSFFQYAPLVIKQAGFSSNVATMASTVGMGLINFIGTIVALLFIDHFGRKKLLVIGTSGIIASQLFLGYITLTLPAGQLQSALAVLGLLLYIFAFAIGPGVIVWLAISELLPTRIRGRAVALCLFVNSLASAVLATVFLDLVSWLGMGHTYYLFASFTMIYFAIAAFLLPETKNKSLEQVQREWQTTQTVQPTTANSVTSNG